MSQYLGDISAYALAVSQGYTGTEEEYAELMASYATVGQTAVTAAQTATTKASEAATSATTATNKASEATTAATTATTKAAEAQADADAAALDASQAMSAASTATTKAEEAATSAATATSAKTDAVAANTAAQSAKTAAQTAQTGAETAAASVSASAEQIATNAADISQLKSDLNVIQTIPHTAVYTNDIANNLIKKHEMIHGYYINASGIQTESSSWNCTDFIDISEYEKVTLSGGAGSFAFYDASYNFISPSGGGNQNGYTVPSGAKYIRVSANNTNIETVMLNGGTTAKKYDDGYYVFDTKNTKKMLQSGLQFLGIAQADTYETVLPDANNTIAAGYYLLNFPQGSISIPAHLPINAFEGSMHLLLIFVTTGVNRLQVYWECRTDKTIIYTRYSGNTGQTWSKWAMVNADIVTAIKEINIIKNEPYNIVYTSGKPNNLIVKSKLIEGYYINSSGNQSAASMWNCTDFVNISGSTKITMSGNVGNSVFYDSSKAAIPNSAISSNGTFDVPSGAAYIRFGVANTNKDTAMASVGTAVLPYDDGTVIISDRIYKRKTIIVDKNGSGDFTSLTEAVRSNANNICDFYVRPGEYDLFTEMKAYYGDSYFDFTSTVYDEGLEIKNGSRFFLDANAVVKFNYTGSNQYVILFFSPFKFSRDGGELHGGQIICSNCRYAIHDDCYTSDYDNRVTDGVYIYYRSDRGVAIGGGLGKSSHVELKNCYVDSELGVGAQYGVFYHNNSQSADAQNFVSIHDNYFTANIIIEPLGPSEHISKALVTNNKAHGVIKVIPSATDNPPDIDNFEMIAWNNVTA